MLTRFPDARGLAHHAALLLALSACTGGTGGGGSQRGGDGGPGAVFPITEYKPPRTYSRKIVNPFRVPVNVIIDGYQAGWLNPGSWNFYNLPSGEHSVVLVNQPYGVYVEDSISVGSDDEDRPSRRSSRRTPSRSRSEEEEGEAEEDEEDPRPARRYR